MEKPPPLNNYVMGGSEFPMYPCRWHRTHCVPLPLVDGRIKLNPTLFGGLTPRVQANTCKYLRFKRRFSNQLVNNMFQIARMLLPVNKNAPASLDRTSSQQNNAPTRALGPWVTGNSEPTNAEPPSRKGSKQGQAAPGIFLQQLWDSK